MRSRLNTTPCQAVIVRKMTFRFRGGAEPAPGGIGGYYEAVARHLPERIRFFDFHSNRSNQSFPEFFAGLLLSYLRVLIHALTGQARAYVVNTSLARAGILRDAVLLSILRIAGRKRIVFLRGWNRRTEKAIDEGGCLQWLFRTTFLRSDAVIVLSTSFKEKIKEWGYRGRIFVETTTVDDELTEKAAPLQKEEPRKPVTVLFLARVIKEKGVFAFTHAVKRVQENGFPVAAIVAGTGTELENVKAEVRRGGIRDVRFPGYVKGLEKARIYREADIYMFPSTHGEGMPNSLLEAMAFGLPVITTPVGGVPDFFEDGRMGYLVDTAGGSDPGEALERLVSCRGRRTAMGNFNAAFARKHFFASRVAVRLTAILDDVAGGFRGSKACAEWDTVLSARALGKGNG